MFEPQLHVSLVLHLRPFHEPLHFLPVTSDTNDGVAEHAVSATGRGNNAEVMRGGLLRRSLLDLRGGDVGSVGTELQLLLGIVKRVTGQSGDVGGASMVDHDVLVAHHLGTDVASVGLGDGTDVVEAR